MKRFLMKECNGTERIKETGKRCWIKRNQDKPDRKKENQGRENPKSRNQQQRCNWMKGVKILIVPFIICKLCQKLIIIKRHKNRNRKSKIKCEK